MATTNKNKYDLGLDAYKFDTSQLTWHNPDYKSFEDAYNGVNNAYEEHKGALNQSYNTDINALDNSWQQFLERDKQNRLDNQRTFASGQQTIAESAFDRSRNRALEMSSRGLGASGLMQAGRVQDRIEQGRSVNELANQFVNNDLSLAQNAKEAQSAYGTQRQKYQDSLRSALADILSQQNASKMSYTELIDSLKAKVVNDKNSVLNTQAEWERLYTNDLNNNKTTQANWNQNQAEWENTLAQQAYQQEQARLQWENTLKQQALDNEMRQREYDESVRQFNANLALQRQRASASGSGSGSSSSSATTAKASITPAQLQTTIEQLKRNGASYDQIDSYIKSSYNVPANFSSWANNDQYGKKTTSGTASNAHKISIY